MDGERIDVTEQFQAWYPTVLKAERCGCNTLILHRAEHLTKAFDGRARRFELVYRIHPSPSAPLNSVQGSEVNYYGHRDVRGWKRKSLFDMFNLF
jgi:hypothetical protein